MSIHLGLIGAGNISATHLRAAQMTPGVIVSAVYSPNSAKAARLAEEAGATPYSSLEDFLAHDSLDIVLIGSPSGVHAEQAIAAAERGLHALVEKPLDISTERVDDVIAAAERHRVRIGVFFQDRLKPDLLRVKQMVDEGRLGIPVLISGRVKWHRSPDYYSGSSWRGTHALDGGGALINQGIHTADVMQWLFGPVISVSAAVATRVHEIEVEDTAGAVLTFANGALGVLECATSIFPGYSRRLELTGSEGTLIVEGDTLVAVDLRSEESPPAAQREPARSPSAVTATLQDASAHARVLEDFVESIRTGRAPACDAREGRKSVAIVEAIYRAARTGGTVPLHEPVERTSGD